MAVKSIFVSDQQVFMMCGLALLTLSFIYVQLTVLVAALATFLYSRKHVLNSFIANAPGRLAKINTFDRYEVKFADRMRNCEDAVLVPERTLAIAACDPGRDKWNVAMVSPIPSLF